jgi:hypothetical protein
VSMREACYASAVDDRNVALPALGEQSSHDSFSAGRMNRFWV